MLQLTDELGFVTELASVFRTRDEAHALLAKANLPFHRLMVFELVAPVHYWHATCTALANGLVEGGLEMLVRAAWELYPGNRVFGEVLATSASILPGKLNVAGMIPSSAGSEHLSITQASGASSSSANNQSPSSQSLVWLHVSDLHFGHGDAKHRMQQERVVAAIIRDAKMMRHVLGRPTFIFVTGDIAFSGKINQYADAKQWLERLAAAVGSTIADVFTVPGNHDINREETRSLISGLLHEKIWSDERFLDELLHKPAEFMSVWRKQQTYATFAESLGAPTLSESAPFWTTTRTTALGSVVLAGLNSSLACYDDRDAPSNLVLGATQVHRTIAMAADDALIISLHHHPAEWLRDGANLINQLQRRPHLDFCGHVHKQGGSVQSPFHGKGIVQFVSGAAHGEKGEVTSYSYAWGRLTTSGLDYFPRVWVELRDEFVADAVTFEFGIDGALHRETTALPKPLQSWLAIAALSQQKD